MSSEQVGLVQDRNILDHEDSKRGRLSDTQRLLIEQRLGNEKPSTGAAYLLCIFFGVLGIHRFYLGRSGSGIAMLLISLTFFGLIITGIWAFIDLFLIPSMIRDRIDQARRRLTLDAIA